MLEVVVFAGVTAILLYVSRRSLFHLSSHGPYRFLAWESAVALVILNAHAWFVDSFSVSQMVSWSLLASSLVLVIYSLSLLLANGKPNDDRVDPTLYKIEKTTVLVSSGVYKYIRHPIYASGIIGTWGVYAKDPSWFGLILAILATLFWGIAAKLEEAECIRYFGHAYQAYTKQTKRFIPRVF